MQNNGPVRYCVKLFSCRRFSEVASLELDRPLTKSERFSLVFHGIYCQLCKRFQKQIHILHNHAKTLNLDVVDDLSTPDDATTEAGGFAAKTLSPEAKERIRLAMEQKGNG